MDAITTIHEGEIQIIDSTFLCAHQQAATAKRRVQIGVSVDHAAGTRPKIHDVVDAQGRPIRLGLIAGQTHDRQIADRLLDHPGPRCIVLADKAYDADRIRELIQDEGLHTTSRQRATASGSLASANGSANAT
jgi:hypothetical protein